MRTTAAPVGHLPWESRARPAAFVKTTTTLTDAENLNALRAIVDRDQVDLWQPVPWTRQQSLAAEVGCAETDVSVLLDQIREERGIKPAWHRRYRKHEAKPGRLREARPFLKEKEKERTMAPKEAPLVRGTTEPAAEVTPAVEPVREKAIAEMTLDEVFRLVDPEITSRKRATIRVWEAMKVARVDPRKTISRDQQEAMLVPIGRLVAHNELSEIRAILRSLGWQDRFGHSKGEAFRAAKAPQSASNGSAQSPELAVPMGSGEMLTDSEVQALAAETWPDNGRPPVSPHPTADADPAPLVAALQTEIQRLKSDRQRDQVKRDLQRDSDRSDVIAAYQERDEARAAMAALTARCADAERRANELANLRGQVQPQRPASLTLILMELLEEITTQVCELRDDADKKSISASDCVAAMVSAFVRAARREVAA